MLNLGIDIGSLTTKIVITDKQNILYKVYKRHYGKIKPSILSIIRNFPTDFRNNDFKIAITGSAGMGLAERTKIEFIQEVIALSNAVTTFYKSVYALIELGGEDAKIILFDDNQIPEMRMNGSCAGGTGSFIDQMAVLLDVSLEELNDLSKKSTKNLRIASRCGVFAKTDVQALANRGEKKSDIAKAVFLAVANQTVTTLFSGAEIKPKILFAGGPLTFLSELRNAFYEVLDMSNDNYITPENSEVLVALGASLYAEKNKTSMNIKEFEDKILNSKTSTITIRTLPTLFPNQEEYDKFKNRHSKYFIEDTILSKSDELFLGIDAGSTTTKLVVINQLGKIIYKSYSNNLGDPLEIVKKELFGLKDYLGENRILSAFSTGYGEEFIEQALNLDGGIVETIAHYNAAAYFNKDVSYIIDIGGQDIKAIKIENNIITNIALNEACSSGTGSFIQTFAKSLDLSLEEFINKAIYAKNPVDLGTRCSVFMNSKVKEALKNGIATDDIACGLAYSVIKNALFKVIKLHDYNELGKNIVVQGGTFKNDAVLRAFELLTKREVVRTNITEFMGAFGVALHAKAKYTNKFRTKFDINAEIDFTKKYLSCKGCGNNCSVTQFVFENENSFFTGNKCEKYFSNKLKKKKDILNFFKKKEELLFMNNNKALNTKFNSNLPIIGFPRVLAMYEHYPFFSEYFQSLGFQTVLSDKTNTNLYTKGLRTVSADNICFPAKIANGHILNLEEKKVDRIFIPTIMYEEKEGNNAKNSYNCPIVTGYGEILKDTMNMNIPIDTIPLSFVYASGLKKNLFKYVKQFKISKKQSNKAVASAHIYKRKILTEQQKNAKIIINQAISENEPLIIILGRPYHLDETVNNGIYNLLYDLGVHTISENAIPELYDMNFDGVLPLTQWSYHNRLYLAAKWVATHSYKKIAIIQLNSFGCGPDAVVVDEVKTIVESGGKFYASIKIDEMANLGAAKIRIRSLLEILKQNNKYEQKKRISSKTYNLKKDKKKTILIPYLSMAYSDFLSAVFYNLGYDMKIIKEQSLQAVDEGLKYVNNDMCYPAIVLIGDLINALKSGKYDLENTVVGLSQTGGQCRASNYVPLLKKALVNAGFLNVPVITIGTDVSTGEGLVFNKLKYLRYSIIALTIGDALMKMRLAVKPYEIKAGETENLFKELVAEGKNRMISQKLTGKFMKSFISYATNKFNKIAINNITKKKIGLVGEIYLKTNCFSNNDIITKIEDYGYEVALPAFTTFIEYDYFSQKYNFKNGIDKRYNKLLEKGIIHKTIEHYRNIMNKAMLDFKFYNKEKQLRQELEKEESPISLSIQFGEGWLLPFEVSNMSKRNIKNVICLQPFGCISNHIVAKGIFRKMKNNYNINMLLLDYESGTSDVNIQNRLELFLNSK